MLEINGLVKHYKDFTLNCTMKVEPGRITGLVGGNGAGKSTTFKAALGLITYDGGSITLMGKTPAHRGGEGENRGYPGGIRVQRLSEGKGCSAGAGGHVPIF